MPTVRLDKMLIIIANLEHAAQKLLAAGGSDVHTRNSVACGLWYAVNDLRRECGLPQRKWPVGSGGLEDVLDSPAR